MVKKDHSVHLYEKIWNSYKSIALIPIIIISLVFVAIFILMNIWTRNHTKDFLIEDSTNELNLQRNKEISIIEEELDGVSYIVDMYRKVNNRALESNMIKYLDEDTDRFNLSDLGVYYSISDSISGGPAVFYSAYYPIDEKDITKVAKILTTQSFMKDAYESHPLIEQIYINTYDSLNVIYPYFDVISQYPPKMNIPLYNFYYLADEDHNPNKDVVWTESYLDPAGLGWMASAIAPVYTNDFLEGVVGVDITINTITEKLLNKELPYDGYNILLGSDGTILALPKAAEIDWGISELTNHDYKQAIMEDTYKPEEYNLHSIEETKGLATLVYEEDNGSDTLVLNNKEFVVSWGTITKTRWKLLVLVEKESIFSEVYKISNKLFNVTTLIFVFLVIFLLYFFQLLHRKAKKTSLGISSPLLEINKLLSKIEHGEYYHEPLKFDVIELNETAIYLQQMGNALEDTTRKLNIAKDEAEKASLAKSEFLSSMSHELRTPLNAIIGFSQVLEMDNLEPLTQNQKLSVTQIHNGGNHLLELVNEILDLSKIEAGQMNVYIEPVLVQDIIEDTFSLMMPIAKERNILLSHKLNNLENQYVYGDLMRAKQVIINLISNAIKYNTENGRVELICKKVDNKISFIIKDTGIGISKEQQANIFEPFTRIHKLNVAIEGTGIGLSISKQLVEMMGSKLEFYSELDNGSIFWFELPICEENVAIKESFEKLNITTLGNSDKKYVILYIEDNISNVNLISHIFKGFSNIEVLTTNLGSSGIDIATTKSPDLVLLDINLPDMTGFEYYNKLKEYDACESIPVVALSANASERNINLARSLGFYEYMTKPIDVKKFISVLLDVLK